MWYLFAYAVGSLFGFLSGTFVTVYFYEKYYDTKPKNGGYDE